MKQFNTNSHCVTKLNYMVDTKEKLKKIIPIKISFEKISEASFKTEQDFCNMLLQNIGENKEVKAKGYSEIFISKIPQTVDLSSFSMAITDVLTTINKKVVLMIDEVDSGVSGIEI